MTKEIKDRVRKVRAVNGERSQKTMSFRVDIELVDWLDMQVNKGRYINNLIMADMQKHKTPPDDAEPSQS